MDKLYTVPEVAGKFRFTTETVWRKCRENAWPHLREGRHYRFTQQNIRDIEDLMSPTPARRKARTARQQFKERLAS
jgi:hypothetical protein